MCIRDRENARSDKHKPFHDAWVSQVPNRDREAIKQLLMLIFPKLQAVWSNTHHGVDSLQGWRRQLRVCSPEITGTYFRLTVPAGGLRNEELQAFIALTDDSYRFGTRILELAHQKGSDGKPRVRLFLARLQDYTGSEILDTSIRPILQALFEVGDTLLILDGDRQQIFEYSIDRQITRITFQLLRRLDKQARLNVLKEVMANGVALSTIVFTIAYLGVEHGKYASHEDVPQSMRLISTEDLGILQELGVKKIKEFTRTSSLLQVPRFGMVLHRWHEWGGDEVKQWVQMAITSDQGLIAFIEKSLSKMLSTSGNYYRLDPEQLKPFLEPSEIIQRLRTIFETHNLSTMQQTAFRQFFHEYELREQGQDPNMAWTENEPAP